MRLAILPVCISRSFHELLNCLFEPRPQIVDNGDGSTAAVWRSAAGRACFRDGEPDGEETIEPRGRSDTVTDPVLGRFDDLARGAMPAAIGYGFPVVARP